MSRRTDVDQAILAYRTQRTEWALQRLLQAVRAEECERVGEVLQSVLRQIAERDKLKR